MNIERKIIDTAQVIDTVFNSDCFPFLREHILDSDEISIIDHTPVINYINNKNFNNNVYTDIRKDSPLKWLGVVEENNLVCLQLILFDSDHIELIIIEKNQAVQTNLSVFPEIINYCKQFNLPIITFPENDKLTEYYKQFGFKEVSNGYIELR